MRRRRKARSRAWRPAICGWRCEDPARLGRLLDDVTRQLPYELVLTIDDGEELLTLVQSATERQRRQQALDMLVALAESPARCKVVLVLRTEYFGQLAGLLPARSGRALWQEFFVGELSTAGMMDAVLGPTSREPILYTDEVPYEKYRFAYEEGLAQQLVNEAATEAPNEQVGAAALVQVVCAMLYEQRVLRQRQNLVRTGDLRQIGGVRGALHRYVQEQLNKLPLPGGTRQAARADAADGDAARRRPYHAQPRGRPRAEKRVERRHADRASGEHGRRGERAVRDR